RPLARVDAGRRDVPCVAGGRRRRLAAHVRVVSLTGLGSGARLVARAARVAATALALGARSRALPGDPGDLRQRDDLDAGHRAPASGLAGLVTPTAALTARPPREPRDLSLALGAALTLAPDDLFEVAEPLQELPLLLLAQRLLRHALHVLGAALDVLGALAECFLELARGLRELTIELAELARRSRGLRLVPLEPLELAAIVRHRRVRLEGLRVLGVLSEQALPLGLELLAPRLDRAQAVAARAARPLHGLPQSRKLRGARLLVLALEPLGELPKRLLGVLEPPLLERLGGGPGETTPLQLASHAVEPQLPRLPLRVERPAELGVELREAGERLLPVEPPSGDVLDERVEPPDRGQGAGVLRLLGELFRHLTEQLEVVPGE